MVRKNPIEKVIHKKTPVGTNLPPFLSAFFKLLFFYWVDLYSFHWLLFFSFPEGLEEEKINFDKNCCRNDYCVVARFGDFRDFFLFSSKMKISRKTKHISSAIVFLGMLSKNQPNRTIFDRVRPLFSNEVRKS